LSYLLDTNVCIQLLNNSKPSVKARLVAEQPTNVYLCTVVQLELIYGAYHSARTQDNLALLERFFSQFTILDFDDRSARIAGQVRAKLAELGTPIGPYDLQIAAIALANSLVLVTHNVSEFSRVNELKIEDWEIEE
jgi:tRNA(fMet)-specific endonuclease VapC